MVNYSDISQLVRDVTELVRKSRDAELIAKAINELVVDNSRMREQLRKQDESFKRSVLTAGFFC